MLWYQLTNHATEVKDKFTIAIYDLLGKELFFLRPTNFTANTYTIELPEIPNGIYLLKIQFGSEIKTKLLTINN